MSAHCNKIVLHMEEDGYKWEAVFDTVVGTSDVSMAHEFLPETAQEKTTITIIRRTKQSMDYAAYKKSLGIFR